MANCSVEGCNGEFKAKGLCTKHYRAQWHQLNRARCLAVNAAWMAAHPEYKRVEYRTPEQHRASVRKSYTKHAERRRVEAREYYAANPDKCKVAVVRWIKANPTKVSGYDRVKRGKRRGAPGKITGAEVRQIMSDPCAYCGAPAEHLDHCTPISRGGWNSADNCVAACASCNIRKGSKTVLEFLGLWPLQIGSK